MSLLSALRLVKQYKVEVSVRVTGADHVSRQWEEQFEVAYLNVREPWHRCVEESVSSTMRHYSALASCTVDYNPAADLAFKHYGGAATAIPMIDGEGRKVGRMNVHVRVTDLS